MTNKDQEQLIEHAEMLFQALDQLVVETEYSFNHDMPDSLVDALFYAEKTLQAYKRFSNEE